MAAAWMARSTPLCRHALCYHMQSQSASPIILHTHRTPSPPPPGVHLLQQRQRFPDALLNGLGRDAQDALGLRLRGLLGPLRRRPPLLAAAAPLVGVRDRVQ